MANEDFKSATYWRDDEELVEHLRRWYGAKSFAELVHFMAEEKAKQIQRGEAQRPLPPLLMKSKSMGKAGKWNGPTGEWRGSEYEEDASNALYMVVRGNLINTEAGVWMQ